MHVSGGHEAHVVVCTLVEHATVELELRRQWRQLLRRLVVVRLLPVLVGHGRCHAAGGAVARERVVPLRSEQQLESVSEELQQRDQGELAQDERGREGDPQHAPQVGRAAGQQRLDHQLELLLQRWSDHFLRLAAGEEKKGEEGP